jgi:SAM-dependent methyltransferase
VFRVNQTRRSYDLVADRYAAEIGDELAHKPLDRAMLDALAELTVGSSRSAGRTEVVADLGCGPGHVASYLSGLGVRVFGLDLSPGMCAVTRRTTALPVGAGDLTALPIDARSVAGIVCLYTVIHLDAAQRAAAYAEFARGLRPGGHALIAFHSSDAEVSTGGALSLNDLWGHPVQLIFRYLDPDAEIETLSSAGLELVARLDREPLADVEHPSRRSYLLVRRP